MIILQLHLKQYISLSRVTLLKELSTHYVEKEISPDFYLLHGEGAVSASGWLGVCRWAASGAYHAEEKADH